MTVTHIVQAGEHIGIIARKYGFENYTRPWDHPNNAELKALREDPLLLAPGDELFIPDRVRLVFNRTTEASHDFRVHIDPLMLKMRLLGIDGEPLANTEVTVRVPPPEGSESATSDEQQLTTDGDGNVSVDVAKHSGKGALIIDGVEFPLRIGLLDPIDTDSGVAQRLSNMGYDVPFGEAVDPDELRAAIEQFQADNDLEVTGERADIETQLEEIYGS
jgi:hypothetical protein